MTTTQALAKLYTKITGSEGRNSAAKIVSDLAEKWGGTGMAATATKAGLVKQAANVAGASGSNVTKAEFKALLDALIEAGIMADAD